MKKYTITVVFNDKGTHSRDIEAKSKKEAEQQFFDDLPTSVLDNVVSTTIQILSKNK
jgi:hypothetical protein